jgi:hypothetical protein
MSDYIRNTYLDKPNAVTSRLLMVNALAQIFSQEIMDQLVDLEIDQDQATFDVLISFKRKRDGGRAVLRVHQTNVKVWSDKKQIDLSEEEKAMIILFLQP